MELYVVFSGLLFILLAMVWSTKSWLNVAIRMILVILSIWALYLVFGPTDIIGALFNAPHSA